MRCLTTLHHPCTLLLKTSKNNTKRSVQPA